MSSVSIRRASMAVSKARRARRKTVSERPQKTTRGVISPRQSKAVLRHSFAARTSALRQREQVSADRLVTLTSAFDAAAPTFDRHRALPSGVPEAIRAAILSAIGGARPRILDLGAGSGRIGRAFVAAGDDYVGVDLSSGMLRAFAEQADAPMPRRIWRRRTASICRSATRRSTRCCWSRFSAA